MSVPSSILPPLGSSETLVWIGSVRPVCRERLAGAEDRRLDLEDVLRGLDDDQVGAALDQAAGLLGEDLDQLAEGDVARGSGRRRRAGSRSGRSSRRRSGPRPPPCGRSRPPCVLISSVCSPRPHSSSFSREPWKVSVSTHLGAGLEHRGVDALDHVGAVEHERLVALALRGRRSPPGSGRTAPGSRPCRRRRRRRARGLRL